MDITSLLQGAVGQQIVGSIANQIGIEPAKAQSVVGSAVPLLLAGLNKNAQNGQSENISSALDKHDGSIFDNLSGFLGGGDTSDGLGILGHIFGSKQSNVESALSQSSGLDTGSVTKILAILAPIVMGYLGQQKTQQSSGSDISSLIGSVMGGNSSQLSGIEKLLDQNGDGNVMDDVLNIGSKLFGGFFK